VDVGEPPQPFDVEQLDRAVELGEVLLEHRIRLLREHLGTELLERRS
jgi:hypothetical protein